MQHDLQVSIIKELMRQLDKGKNNDAGVQYRMPTSSYVCPDLADKEWTTLFRQHPQMIGLSGDLPEPGSFFTIDDFGGFSSCHTRQARTVSCFCERMPTSRGASSH